MKRIFVVVCILFLMTSAFARDTIDNRDVESNSGIQAISNPDTENATAQTNYWAGELSGFSHHFNEADTGHAWTWRNWGAGLEYVIPVQDSDWSSVYSLGTVTDSFGTPGAYAGIAAFNTLINTRLIQAQAGIGAFALWRTFKWGGNRKLIVAPLPLLHFNEPVSGFGINITYAPKAECELVNVHTSFIFLQITKKF